jgi:hypothetical protein
MNMVKRLTCNSQNFSLLSKDEGFLGLAANSTDHMHRHQLEAAHGEYTLLFITQME